MTEQQKPYGAKIRVTFPDTLYRVNNPDGSHSYQTEEGDEVETHKQTLGALFEDHIGIESL